MNRNSYHLTAEQAAMAIALLNDGRSQRYVARRLEINQSTVSRIAQRYQETGELKRRSGQGRKRVTSQADDRFVLLTSLRNRHLTAPQLQNELHNARNVEVSERTIRRRLIENNLTSRRPANGPLLLPHHKRARLQFARNHIHWTADDWGRVLFTDESRFALNSPDGRLRVWRRSGERYAQCAMVGRESFGGGTLMVWGGINLQAKTDLVHVGQGALKAHRYIAQILEPHVVPFVGNNFLFMQDNARPHVARVVTRYFEEVQIQKLDWPARSPDCNPIEHVWDKLGRSIKARRNRPQTLNQLLEALNEEWEQMDHAVIQELILSMPRRMAAVIQAGGGNTRY
jgi:transposase